MVKEWNSGKHQHESGGWRIGDYKEKKMQLERKPGAMLAKVVGQAMKRREFILTNTHRELFFLHPKGN